MIMASKLIGFGQLFSRIFKKIKVIIIDQWFLKFGHSKIDRGVI